MDNEQHRQDRGSLAVSNVTSARMECVELERIGRSTNWRHEKETLQKMQQEACEQHDSICGWRCGHNVIVSQHCMQSTHIKLIANSK